MSDKIISLTLEAFDQSDADAVKHADGVAKAVIAFLEKYYAARLIAPSALHLSMDSPKGVALSLPTTSAKGPLEILAELMYPKKA